MTDATQMLTPKDVADKLGVHQKTVHLWLRSGKLQGIKISYRAWRIPTESLDSFIEANSNKPGKAGGKIPAENLQEQKDTKQITLMEDKKEEISNIQSKMKYYIRDIMGEKSSENK
nr:helix-turn-helix domain-containing protein [uncultured Methanoregula sp.]